MIKYIVAAILIGGFWFFSTVSIAMMGGGPGAMLKRSFWNFAGSFIAIEAIAGLLLFFWFYKKDSFFASFILISCLISVLYLTIDLKKDFLFFLSVTPVSESGSSDERFFISKDNVFYGNIVLDGLDPQSFQLFTVAGKKYASLSHVKDKNGVYALDIKIPSVKIHPMNVDMKSFSALGYGYAIDDTAVYYNENKLEEANPKGFVVEEMNSEKYYDASDGVHTYKEGKLAEDPALQK